MGYANLGDYANVSGKTIPDVVYNRMPSGLKSAWHKVAKVTTVSPLPPVIVNRLPAALVQKVSPTSPPPRVLAPPTTSPVQQAAAQIIDKVTPVAAPLVGPAAALLPPIATALQQPETYRVAVSTGASPIDTAPMPPASDTTVFNPDGSPAGGVNQASVAGGTSSSVLQSLSNLPTIAKAAIALGAFALFGRK